MITAEDFDEWASTQDDNCEEYIDIGWATELLFGLISGSVSRYEVLTEIWTMSLARQLNLPHCVVECVLSTVGLHALRTALQAGADGEVSERVRRLVKSSALQHVPCRVERFVDLAYTNPKPHGYAGIRIDLDSPDEIVELIDGGTVGDLCTQRNSETGDLVTYLVVG